MRQNASAHTCPPCLLLHPVPLVPKKKPVKAALQVSGFSNCQSCAKPLKRSMQGWQTTVLNWVGVSSTGVADLLVTAYWDWVGHWGSALHHTKALRP